MRISALLPDARRWEEIWQHAAPRRRRLLLVDFDGTLAPLVADRAAARPQAGAVELLERIAAGGATRVAIVSGRPVAELEALLPGFGGTLVGEHGWEIAPPGEPARRHELSPSAQDLLERARTLAEPVAAPLAIETKRTALVLHARGVDPALADQRFRALLEVWFPLLRRAEIDLRVIDGGWELRARGRNKGTAVEELAQPPARPPFVVHLGDDESDEDAFRLIARRGIGFGIHVGEASVHTWAQARLPGVAEVGEFLELWTGKLESAPVGPAS